MLHQVRKGVYIMSSDSNTQGSANHALIRARQKRGWSETDVARQLGVSRRTYCRWEQGQQKPGFPHLRQLCELFNTDAEGLGFNL
jgi:transcriptional regulator with XRE-family HTH domain